MLAGRVVDDGEAWVLGVFAVDVVQVPARNLFGLERHVDA